MHVYMTGVSMVSGWFPCLLVLLKDNKTPEVRTGKGTFVKADFECWLDSVVWKNAVVLKKKKT